jgi:MraZ protein
MVIGQYTGKVDEKSRVAFPKKFREEFGDELIITQGFESSLIIVPIERWKTLLEGTLDRPLIDTNAREVQRFLLGQANEVALDEKGRLLIPDYLKTFAGIETEVIFLGLSRYVEVWNKTTWDSYNTGLRERIPTIAEKLSGKE